jgi:hypothetical protein
MGIKGGYSFCAWGKLMQEGGQSRASLQVQLGVKFEINTDFKRSLVAKIQDGSVAIQGNQAVFLGLSCRVRTEASPPT